MWRDSGLKADALIGVGVDRLDYTKGMEERLLAVERLLERHPEFRGRFSFAQIAAPSRTKIERYQELNARVEALATRSINGSAPRTTSRSCCCARITSRRGVRLLSRGGRLLREQPARRNEPGGQGVRRRAHDELTASWCSVSSPARHGNCTEALIVNPYDLEGQQRALAIGAAMPEDEQQERMRSMRSLARRFNVTAGPERCWWMRPAFATRSGSLDAWPCTRSKTRGAEMHYLLSKASRPVLTRLAKERTLCAFDFDGTLAPIVEHPDQACMRARTRYLLARLAALFPCVIFSGRKRADVLGKLSGVAVERVFGSHGAEAVGPVDTARPGAAMEGCDRA